MKKIFTSALIVLISLSIVSAIGEYDIGGNRKAVCGEKYFCPGGESVDYCYLNITKEDNRTIIRCDCDENPEQFCPKQPGLWDRFWDWIFSIFNST